MRLDETVETHPAGAEPVGVTSYGANSIGAAARMGTSVRPDAARFTERVASDPSEISRVEMISDIEVSTPVLVEELVQNKGAARAASSEMISD